MGDGYREKALEAECDRLNTGNFRICVNGGCILSAEDTHCDCPDCHGAEGLSPTELLDRMNDMEAELVELRKQVEKAELFSLDLMEALGETNGRPIVDVIRELRAAAGVPPR